MAIVRDQWGNPIKAGYGESFDPSVSRRSQAGLAEGGGAEVHGYLVTEYEDKTPQNDSELGVNLGSIKAIPSNNKTGSARITDDDWRVRVSLPTKPGLFYHDSKNLIMAPLRQTNGVVFPYTPSIQIRHAANYTPVSPTHSNYPVRSYQNSEATSIVIQGDFTAQNREEADYVLAMIMYFRSATKMFWGKDELAGQPPPIMYLDGYGDNYFPHVPVVVTGFVHHYPNDVDYIPTKSERNMIPAKNSVTLNLEAIYSRIKMHNEFNLGDYSRGTLIGNKNSGGFI